MTTRCTATLPSSTPALIPGQISCPPPSSSSSFPLLVSPLRPPLFPLLCFLYLTRGRNLSWQMRGAAVGKQTIIGTVARGNFSVLWTEEGRIRGGFHCRYGQDEDERDAFEVLTRLVEENLTREQVERVIACRSIFEVRCSHSGSGGGGDHDGDEKTQRIWRWR
eukprot:765242-Hanusia_phi.AAC.2